MEYMGLNPKNNPISVVFKTRQREGTFLKEKEPNSGSPKGKKGQDKIKVETFSGLRSKCPPHCYMWN